MSDFIFSVEAHDVLYSTTFAMPATLVCNEAGSALPVGTAAGVCWY